MTCTNRIITTNTPRLVLETKIISQKHEPYEWALPGTLENLGKVDEYLLQRGRVGYLFGGCLNKNLPRKDIDVWIEQDLDSPERNCGYKILGVDWWINPYPGASEAQNVNGIKVEMDRPDQNYAPKGRMGLLLPTGFIIEHPRSKLIKLLYSGVVGGIGR